MKRKYEKEKSVIDKSYIYRDKSVVMEEKVTCRELKREKHLLGTRITVNTYIDPFDNSI